MPIVVIADLHHWVILRSHPGGHLYAERNEVIVEIDDDGDLTIVPNVEEGGNVYVPFAVLRELIADAEARGVKL